MSFESIVSNALFGWLIRGAQLLFTILNLGLGAFSADSFSGGGSIGWFLTVTVLTLVYLIGLIVISFFFNGRFFISGAIIIIESALSLFWFIAFIVIAADYGGINCSYSYGGYYYSYFYNKSACGATKALIAFGLFNFLLFAFTAVVIGLFVIKTSLASKVSIWLTNSRTHVQLNKPVLAFSSIPFAKETHNDLETAVGSDAPVEHEKVVDDGILPETHAANAQEQPGQPVLSSVDETAQPGHQHRVV